MGGTFADILSILFNSAIVAMTAAAMWGFFGHRGGSANMKVENTRCFEYFTVDSNLLVSICAVLTIVFKILRIAGAGEIPYWATVLKFTGVTAVTLTFVVVMTILGPAAGYRLMFEGGSLFMHLITPAAAMVTFVFFDGGTAIPWSCLLYALIPTFVYAVVYFTMVIIVGEKKGGWVDFYGFNKGGRWYLSFVVIMAMTALIALLLRLGHNAFVSL